MPAVWEQNTEKVAVTVDELVPTFFNSYDTLKLSIWRTEKKNYGIKRLQRACYGRPMLIDFDTLDREIQMALGDPRRCDHVMEQWFILDKEAKAYYASKRLNADDPTSYLPGRKQEEYTLNASVLRAVRIFRDKHVAKLAQAKKKAKKLYAFMADEAQNFQDILKVKFGQLHTLPKSERQFRDVFDGFFAVEGCNYDHLISGKLLNDNARKLVETQQHALLRKLIGHGNNLNYAQIAEMYNAVADLQDWKKITRKTVENFALTNKLYTEPGRRGESNFDNTLAMQHKRRKVGYPMTMWSIDGWDVELMYQDTSIDDKGYSHTTYHNRPNLVMVFDPYSEYIIGYAIGDHETPELIRQAVRNAVLHTEELTGTMMYPHQFQSDHYGKGNLTPFFEAAAAHYIPAKVKNAKSKPIEHFFDKFNTSYFQYLNNWSGHNVTSKNDNQPNAEWKNKIRHSFPDWQGVVAQIENAIQMDRNKKRAEYLKGMEQLPNAYRHTWSTEEFLYQLGEKKQRTSHFGADGIGFTIAGTEYQYDSFDIQFRNYTYIDWQIRYNPSDMKYVLATNEDDTIRFVLEEKYAESMTLAERTEKDNAESARINQFGKALKSHIMEVSESDYESSVELLNMGEGNDTLAKMLIVDNMGQHKDRKNEGRLLVNKKPQLAKPKAEKKDSSAFDNYMNYLGNKVDINAYK